MRYKYKGLTIYIDHALHPDVVGDGTQEWVMVVRWAMFLFRDILVRIRIQILGSVEYLWLTDLDPAPDPALFISDLQDVNEMSRVVFMLSPFWRYIYILLQR